MIEFVVVIIFYQPTKIIIMRMFFILVIGKTFFFVSINYAIRSHTICSTYVIMTIPFIDRMIEIQF